MLLLHVQLFGMTCKKELLRKLHFLQCTRPVPVCNNDIYSCIHNTLDSEKYYCTLYLQQVLGYRLPFDWLPNITSIRFTLWWKTNSWSFNCPSVDKCNIDGKATLAMSTQWNKNLKYQRFIFCFSSVMQNQPIW